MAWTSEKVFRTTRCSGGGRTARGHSEGEDVFFTLTNEVLVMKMAHHQRTFGLFGDQISPGVSIVNSEVGILAFAVQAFFLRLICRNGMVVEERMGSKIRHIRENALEDFHGMMSQAAFLAEGTRERMMLSVQRKVTDPLTSIDNFNRRFGVAKREGEIVKEAWLREPTNTMWG